MKPNDDKTWLKRGNALADKGKYQEAIKCYNKALEINPECAYAWIGKGSALGIFGNHQESMKCLEIADKLF